MIKIPLLRRDGFDHGEKTGWLKYNNSNQKTSPYKTTPSKIL